MVSPVRPRDVVGVRAPVQVVKMTAAQRITVQDQDRREVAQRLALFAAARRGDPLAIDELWRLYRVRLVPVGQLAGDRR